MSCLDGTLSHQIPLELLLLCQSLTPLVETHTLFPFSKNKVCMKCNVILLT